MRKNEKKLFLIFAIQVLFLLVFWIEAEKGTGGIPGAFLSWGAGARSLAMGKAFVAVSDDASATYWNPGGLGKIERQELMMLHTMLWAGTTYDFISYVKPMTQMGAIGLSLVRMYTGGFEGYDIYNERTINFSDDQMTVSMSVGKKIFKTLSIGANAKYLKHTLAGVSNSSFLIDIGGIYQIPRLKDLSVALNIQNVFENEIEASEDNIPITLRLGLAYRQLKRRLLTTLDVVSIGGLPTPEIHFGIEFWPWKYFAFRAGLDQQEKSFGFGITWQNLGFDYAMAMHDLGLSHRISASVKFGPSIAAKRQMQARQEYLKAHAAFEKGYFERGKDFLKNAVSLDPTNPDYLYEYDRVDIFLGEYKEAPSPSKEHELLRRSFLKYLDRRVDHALEILRYLLTLDPGNGKVINLIQKIREKEGITEPEPELPQGISLVDKKLYDSLNYFYEGNYEKALKYAQEALILEPNSALAYKRIGSAFYAMGEIDKAVFNWKKSLEIDPTDENLRQFVNKIEAEKKGEPIEGIDFLKSVE